MNSPQTMFVIERYRNSQLEYWSGHSDHFNTWTEKFDHACKFYDYYSAGVILAWPLDGMGRVAEHAYVAKEKQA